MTLPALRHRMPAAAAVAVAIAAVALLRTLPTGDTAAAGSGRPDTPGAGAFASPETAWELVDTWPVPEVTWGAEPADVALGDDGTLYVADASSGRVLRFNADGAALESWGPSFQVAGLEPVPVRVAVDSRRGRVFVLWTTYQEDLGHVPGPAPSISRVDVRRLDGTVENRLRVAVPDNTKLAVAPTTGYLLFARGGNALPYAAPPGAIRPPPSVSDTDGISGRLAALPQDRFAMLRPRRGGVVFYGTTGDEVGYTGLAGDEAVDLAADGDGTVYVLVRPQDAAAADARAVVRIDPTSLEVTGAYTLSGLGAPAVPDVAWPWSISASRNGFAFVTAADDFEVDRFDVTGAPVTAVAGGPVAPWAPEARPSPPGGASLALATAPDGGLLALSGASAAVVSFGPTGTASTLGRVPGDTVDLAALPGGDLVVATAGDRLLRLEPAETVTATWSISCGCRLGGRLDTGAGVVYVTRPRDSEIAAIDAGAGATVAHMTLADAVGLWPADVAVTTQGRLLSADLVVGRIHLWVEPGAPLTAWQTGLLAGPRRVAARALDDGADVFAVITADGYVEVHESSGGNLLSRWQPTLSDGSTFPMADIALGGDGRVFLADAAAQAVRVFAPGAGATPTPVANPSATPTPSDLSCTVAGDKVAAPGTIVLGETAAVTLTLAADCPGKTHVVGADIVLVIDGSGSMFGAKLAAAKQAAQNFVELLDVRYHRVAVISFDSDAVVDVPLTDQVVRVVDGIEGISSEGGTDVFKAITLADDHLTAQGRSDALPAIVLLTDGRHGGEGDPRAAAQTARNRGVQIYTIGLGTDADVALLADMAGSAERYFFAPRPEELFPIYGQILRLVVSSLAGNLIIDDEMGDDITYLPGSPRPPALEGTGRLRWGRSLLPASGITLSYTIRPQVPGLLPTNRQAAADYLDADGVRRNYVFPVPQILVVTPTPTPTPVPRFAFLPIAYRNRCIPGVAHADVVLAVDTSGSMAGAKLAKAKAAASLFAGQLDLPRDQAAVIGFNSAPHVATGLTGNLETIRAAIDGLASSPGTRIDAALRAAGSELAFSPTRNARNRGVIILLSDGAHNGPAAEVFAAAQEVAPLASAIYAIGLGSDVDANLLRTVAGPGRYYFAPDEEALADVYRTIAVRIPCR